MRKSSTLKSCSIRTSRVRVTNLPQLTIRALRLVDHAARGELVLTSVLQIVTALTLAAQVLVGKKLLEYPPRRQHRSQLPDHPYRGLRPWRGSWRSPPSPAFFAWSINACSASSLLARRPSKLSPLPAAPTSFSLENPTFHDRLQRAIVNTTVRPLQMTTGLVTVMGSLLSTLAIGFTLVLIGPLFAVLAIVAGVPVTLTNLRVGRALYSFDVEQTPTDREHAYVQILLTGKDSAKDVRAYDLTDYLRARFDSPYARRIDALQEADPAPHRSTRGSPAGF